MRLDQIGDAERLARKLASMKARREEWTTVDLTDSLVTRRINDGSRQPNRLPSLEDDLDMHQAIVEAILAEYDTRINTIMHDLLRMGVEL